MSTLTLNDIDYRIAKYGRITRDEPRQEELDAIVAEIRGLTSREAKGDGKPVAWLYSWDGAGHEAERCVVADASEQRARERAARLNAELIPLYTAPAAHEASQPDQRVVAYRTRSKKHPKFVGNWVDGDIPPEHVADEEEFYIIERAVLAKPASLRTPPPSFQARVSWWMDQCFLPSLYSNMTERGDRLLEEVLELLQAHGYDRDRVPTLVDYVYARPVGVPRQEVGGVMVTLGGYCWIAGLDMHACGETELARINKPEVMAKIRAKQEAKNAIHFDTPLPGSCEAGQS